MAILFICESGEIYILRNEGNRVFTEIRIFDPAQTPPSAYWAALLGDLTGNGYQDIIVLCGSPSSADVFFTLLNDGSSDFEFGGSFVTGSEVSFFVPLAIDMDGCADLSVYSGGDICIYKGEGNGMFQYEPALFSITDVEPPSMTFNDYDCDGDPDMVCVISSNDECYLRTYWNNTNTQGCEGESLPPVGFNLRASSNPFSSTVEITASQCSCPAQLTIHDVFGRIITEILPESEGLYHWDGNTLSGEQAPSGVYIVSAEIPGYAEAIKLMKLN